MPKIPSVIAHRGASGYLPEHTLEAKALAHGLGADYIEQDVVATRDGVLVVLHDIYLDLVTDVEAHYPERRREDGHYYVIDFELDELRRLGVMERRRESVDESQFPARFPRAPLKFSIATLEEEILLIQGLNKSTGRTAGIYPELKDPAWHLEHGIDMSHLLLTALESFGYTSADDDVIVQSFDAAELRRLRQDLGTPLKLTQLVGGREPPSSDTLGEISQYADGLGLPYVHLIDASPEEGGDMQVSALRAAIDSAGLAVHPYTLRADSLPPFSADFGELLRFLFEDVEVDGLFCDHPDQAVAVRDRLS